MVAGTAEYFTLGSLQAHLMMIMIMIMIMILILIMIMIMIMIQTGHSSSALISVIASSFLPTSLAIRADLSLLSAELCVLNPDWSTRSSRLR